MCQENQIEQKQRNKSTLKQIPDETTRSHGLRKSQIGKKNNFVKKLKLKKIKKCFSTLQLLTACLKIGTHEKINYRNLLKKLKNISVCLLGKRFAPQKLLSLSKLKLKSKILQNRPF